MGLERPRTPRTAWKAPTGRRRLSLAQSCAELLGMHRNNAPNVLFCFCPVWMMMMLLDADGGADSAGCAE